jgi:hypothetical protein
LLPRPIERGQFLSPAGEPLLERFGRRLVDSTNRDLPVNLREHHNRRFSDASVQQRDSGWHRPVRILERVGKRLNRSRAVRPRQGEDTLDCRLAARWVA